MYGAADAGTSRCSQLRHVGKSHGAVPVTKELGQARLKYKSQEASCIRLWLAVGAFCATVANSYMISNRRNKVRCERERERQLGNSPRMCAISSHKSLPGTGIAVYRWLSCVSSTIAQHLFAPAGGGVAAHCKGIRGQCVEQEEQRPHETLAPEQAFEMMKPGVVRVYAILPELASACQQEGCMASPGRNPHVVERFHFLGSGFFFDDRGKRLLRELRYACKSNFHLQCV